MKALKVPQHSMSLFISFFLLQYPYVVELSMVHVQAVPKSARYVLIWHIQVFKVF